MKSKSEKKLKVIIIGLDGATFNVLNPLIKENELPTIEYLIKSGASGILKSTFPPISGPAWFSFRTGKNPGKTGIYDFVKRQFDSYELQLMDYSSIKIPSFYDILNDSGFSIGVVNLPGTYPPHVNNGFMICGFLTPSDQSEYMYPPILKDDIKKIIGEYKIDVRHGNYNTNNIEQFIEDTIHLIKIRKKTVKFLKDAYDPDLLLVIFTSTDRVQHSMWKFIDQNCSDYKNNKNQNLVKLFFNELDKAIADLLQNNKNDNTIIFLLSDHGFGSQNKKFFVNKWLKENGYLYTNKKQNSITFFLKIKKELKQYLLMILKKLGIYNNFKNLLSYRTKKRKSSKPSYFKLIDWSKTMAYSFPHTSIFGNIYINLKGRESEGIVTIDQYDQIREKIISDLKTLCHPKTKQKLNVKAFKREEVYFGPYLDEAPDILYYIDNFECISLPSINHKTYIEDGSMSEMRNGTHRMDGIIIANGFGIQKNKKIENAQIIDIFPTILHIFGLPIPKDIDGKVLKEIFTPDSAFSHKKINYKESIQKNLTEEWKIKKKIKELKDSGNLIPLNNDHEKE